MHVPEPKPSPKEKFLFIADDFGLDADTNRAILHSHFKGALHGTALMMGQPGTEEAVAMARDHPSLRIGLHWHFNDSRPLTQPAWPWGNSTTAAGWAIGLWRPNRDLVLREAEAQMGAFLATGLPASFLNSHHHLQIHPMLWRPLWRLAERLPGAWLRLGWPYFFDRSLNASITTAGAWLLGTRPRHEWHGVASAGLWGLDRTFAMRPDEVRRAVALNIPDCQEFIFHPRRCDDQDTRCLIELRQSPLSS
ncbi:MAG TPA: ChbG/HpnK family deacetylase [Opitutales bacterium]|jgi:hypothetical protein|nr:ChbG/HpnK family deacetylase [Opitutales bacterium]